MPSPAYAPRVVQGSVTPLAFQMFKPTGAPLAGAAGSIVVLIAKNAGYPRGGFAAADGGGCIEVGGGFYSVPGSAVDSNTLGPLLLVASAAGNPTTAARYDVVAGPTTPPVRAGSPGYPLPIYIGVAGISPSLLLAAVGSGGGFAPPTGVVEEVGGPGNGRGWYRVDPNGADLATAGALALVDAGGTSASVFDVAPSLGISTSLGTTFADVLLAARLAVVAAGIAPDQLVALALDPEPKPGSAGPFIVVTPSSGEVDRGAVEGGGRADTIISAGFSVHVIDQAQTDIFTGDTNRLTATSPPGLFRLAHAVINALTVSFLYDPAGKDLVVEPIRLVRHMIPRKYASAGSKPAWAGVELLFEVKYVASLGNIDG